ncbi:MAG: hypothetical protein QOC63_5753 [Mycobacterium sp.]|jgi:hypothetical protein|nr:hypothetical protein [Mycobacterium sp.]
MLVIVGLIILLVAAIVAIVGALSNARAGHPLTDFSVFGYHLTASTGTLFLFGIAVGAVASLGLCLLLAGARRKARRISDGRRGAARLQRRPPSLGRWISGEYTLTGRAVVPPQSRQVIAREAGAPTASVPD